MNSRLMVDLREDLLQQEFIQVFKALAQLSRQSQEESLGDLPESIEACQTLALLHQDPSIRTLCEGVGDLLNRSSDWEQLSAREQEALRYGCEELRFRIIAAGMGVEPPAPDGEGKSPLDLEERLRTSVLSIDPSGLVSCDTGDHVVLLLPKVLGMVHLEQVCIAIDTVTESVSSRVDWVVDFSSLEELPVELLASVIYHISRLQDHGASLFVSWLKKSALTAAQSKALVRLLDLVEIGGFWFSSGVRG